MRIDLPTCNLKTCKYFAFGNCSGKEKYDTCEYTRLNVAMERIVERLKELSNYHDFSNDKKDIAKCIAYQRAIEIVKEELG